MCRLLPFRRDSCSAESFGLRLAGEVALLTAEQCFAFNRFSHMGRDFDATGPHGVLMLLFFAGPCLGLQVGIHASLGRFRRRVIQSSRSPSSSSQVSRQASLLHACPELTWVADHVAVETWCLGVFAERHGGSSNEVAQQGDDWHGPGHKGSVSAAVGSDSQSAAVEPALHV